MLLEASLAGQADAIVSGDNDLLTMNLFEGIPMLSPAAFLRMLQSQSHTQRRMSASARLSFSPE